VSETVRQVSDHPLKKSFDATPSDVALRSEDGWVDMDVRWLLTRETVGAQHSVFGITVLPAGLEARHSPAPERRGVRVPRLRSRDARVGDADVELGPGEVAFVPKNEYHGFENTGDEAGLMIWAMPAPPVSTRPRYFRLVGRPPLT